MNDPHTSFLHDAGPMAPEQALTSAPTEALPTLAAILAELGTEGLQVGACLPMLPGEHASSTGTFRLFHWERPEVVLHLEDDVAAAVRQTAELLQTAAQLEREAEAAEQDHEAETARGLTELNRRQDALAHLIYADEIGELAESPVMQAMARGGDREAALKRIDRIRAAVAAVPEEAWLPTAPAVWGGASLELAAQPPTPFAAQCPAPTTDTLTPE